MKALSSIGADVRALGPAFVVRALYEGGKRFGLLGVLLRMLRVIGRVQDRDDPHLDPRVAVVGAHGQEPVRYRQEVEVFGRQVVWSSSTDWHWTVEKSESWPKVHWWRIDLRSDRRLADVKWSWEVGRHAHLVTLARTARTSEEAAKALELQLQSWLQENAPEIGVHWYSNLEIALRAVAWVQILDLAGDRLPATIRREMISHLRHAGRHLLVELPYTVSSMRNNHLLGDALGMMAIAEASGPAAEGRVLRCVGNRMFSSQLRRQVREDGSMIEDSISYHRFSLEMLAVRAALRGSREEVKDALRRAGQFMFRLGVGDGPLPQYGDWDEGRVLAVSTDRCELLGSARLALALAGTGAPEEWHEAHEEVAWHAPVGEPVAPAPAERDGRDVGGGIGRAQRGSFTAWLKAGSQRSHGHADLCSTPILFDGEWLVGDPGTGTYNGPIEQRNYFRCSIAHNVLRVDGLDQLEPHRAFRWHHTARGVVGPPLQVGDATVMWGVHDAYRRLEPSRRVARAVFVSDQLVVVADWVEGPTTSYAMSFPLHPSVEWDDGALVLASGRRVGLELPSEPSRRAGQDAPYDGWWSRTYGHAEPATRLEITGTTERAVVWALRADSKVALAAEGTRLLIGDDSFEVQWRNAGATLTHTRSDGRQVTATVALA